MKKWITMVSATALFCSLTGGSVLAFDDVEGDQKAPVLSLKDRGVISGIDDKHFVPMGKVSYAQSVHMIVKGLGLNIDNIRFIKQPEASDYFTNVPNNAWYAQSFIIAQLNGLPIPKDVDPNGTMTREQFADLLVHAIEKKGDFPTIKMYIQLADEDQVTPEMNGSVQRLLLYKITNLGQDRKFNPKREMSRGEAAVWLYNAIKLVESHKSPVQQEEIKVSIEKVTDDVNKVVLSRGEKPTAGYGIAITGIRFEQDGRAVVTYTVSDPAPDSMNAQVITEPKAETYVSSKFKVEAEPAAVLH